MGRGLWTSTALDPFFMHLAFDAVASGTNLSKRGTAKTVLNQVARPPHTVFGQVLLFKYPAGTAGTENMSSTIRIAPERVLAILSIIIVALSVLHLATQFAAQTYEGLRGAGLISRIFDMDEEVSLPTWFSQSILLAVAVLAFAIGRVRRSQELKDTAPWFGLSGIFL